MSLSAGVRDCKARDWASSNLLGLNLSGFVAEDWEGVQGLGLLVFVMAFEFAGYMVFYDASRTCRSIVASNILRL